MYKLLIVDDEKIERQGMAELIPWGSYGIELAGTAWNGQDVRVVHRPAPVRSATGQLVFVAPLRYAYSL